MPVAFPRTAISGAGTTNSSTTKSTEHWLAFPAASVAVNVTACTPIPISVPAAGTCTICTGPLQSVATQPTVKSGTADCTPAATWTVRSSGHAATAGASTSRSTMTFVHHTAPPEELVTVVTFVYAVPNSSTAPTVRLWASTKGPPSPVATI